MRRQKTPKSSVRVRLARRSGGFGRKRGELFLEGCAPRDVLRLGEIAELLEVAKPAQPLLEQVAASHLMLAREDRVDLARAGHALGADHQGISDRRELERATDLLVGSEEGEERCDARSSRRACRDAVLVHEP